MEQMLPRGYSLPHGKRIKKLIAQGENWEIYSTNFDSWVLAVTTDLYAQWIRTGILPDGLFQTENPDNCCCIFSGSENYLISSMEGGPFPRSIGQVNAFSATFRMVCEKYPDMDFHNAIYIEEYSLLLPVSRSESEWDRGLTYGKWLCAGVDISIESFDHVCRIMSWMPDFLLKESAIEAGFQIQESVTDTLEKANLKASVTRESEPAVENNLPEGQFRLVGRPQLEQFFHDNIVDIVLHREQYERMGISFPGATILHGPPGCGKTYAVDRLCEYLGWKRYDIDSSTIGSSYIHDTSKKIAGVFQEAINNAPSVLVIDEMESYLSDRGASGSSGAHHVEEVAEFLRRIPEAVSKGVLIFAMTNMIDRIDPAILRRGRFDHIVEVQMPSSNEIRELLSAKLAALPVDETIDISYTADRLANHPMSDVSFVLREAGRLAIKNGQEKIDMRCIQGALELLPDNQNVHNRIGFI